MLLGARMLLRGRPVRVVPSGIIRTVLGAYLDWIGGRVDALPPVGRALVQVLATVVLVTVLANLLRWAGFRLALGLPDAAESSFRRDTRAEAAAAELLPGVDRARSVLAGNYGDRPPDTTGPCLPGWQEARELQGPAGEGELARWARVARVEERLIETVSRTTTFFGASSRSSFRPLGRPATVLMSAALVLWLRPPWQLPSVGTIADSVATAVVDARPGRVLPFALLALGLWMVARPFPVVDRIRARDEAAKDANKLLAELYGQLTQLSYVLYQWREELLAGRHDRVASYVEEATQGRHSWGPGGGLIAARHVVPFRRTAGRFPGPEVVGGRLTAQIEAIETLDAFIRDKGLVVVARRLTWRVRYPMGELGLLRPLGLSPGMPRATCAPSALYTPNLALVPAPGPSLGKAHVLAVLDDHLLERIESEAFNYARVLDMSIAKVILCQAHVQRVARHLGSRMVGSWWTRTLSLVQK